MMPAPYAAVFQAHSGTLASLAQPVVFPPAVARRLATAVSSCEEAAEAVEGEGEGEFGRETGGWGRAGVSEEFEVRDEVERRGTPSDYLGDLDGREGEDEGDGEEGPRYPRYSRRVQSKSEPVVLGDGLVEVEVAAASCCPSGLGEGEGSDLGF